MIKHTLILFVLAFYFQGNISIIYGQQKIIGEGDEWMYNDTDSIPHINWVTSSPKDEKWKTGISPFGYGDEHIETIISYGGDPDNKHVSKYFKKTFSMENPFQFLAYELKVQRDDGIVVYLNGREVWRNNMPEGEINYNTTASHLVLDRNEKVFVTKILLPEDFVYGLNTLSISVHQAQRASTDCLFNLELIGNNSPEMLPLLLKEHSIKNIELSARIKEVKYKMEIEERDLRLDLAERAKREVKIASYIISAILIITLSLFLLVCTNGKKREKRLAQDILDLKNKVSNKDQELMSLSLNSLNNQQYLKELKLDLEKGTSGDLPSIKAKLSKISSQLEYQLEYDDDWENLKKHFSAVHTGFFDKIYQLHPSLTEAELRHCVFIKLHMQTKEIARILHIDPRSVQTSRYRIKKKLALDENTDLREYLKKF
ncbi:hypothetical protein GWK08_15475 [Leptobacterium flavescens]|uniref:HTH luxR-type domain-containing protein n=1 Tax=Leptobacterium flavescens TaxID=472055 RepID=A0A6P0UWP2_9FLAO|nr:hypothetical protein [Leptobacterium flavescens]NER14856.1 hypothetical protein [Leptobacterium flavescens]